jgi:transcriptional regulator with XRE-family HTH domain
VDVETAGFGRRLRELRKRAGLSQEEFAAKIQIHRTYIGAVERGERNPSLKNILKFARALNVEPASLFRDWEGPVG